MTVFSSEGVLLSIALLLLTTVIFTYANNKRKSRKLPPSPLSLPLVGHLHLLKQPLHQSLSSLAEQYGALTFLKFGTRPVLVVSSRSLAEQCFTTHDVAFSNRPHLPSAQQVSLNYEHIVTANYGRHWRNIREIAVVEVLSGQRLHALSGVRAGEILDMIRGLFKSWNKAPKRSKGSEYFVEVELKTKLFEFSLNVLMTTIAGKRFYGESIDDMEETKRFREVVEELFSLTGASNVEDFLPILGMLGMRGATKRLNHLAEINIEMTRKLIDGHRRAGGENKKTVISNLLELQKQDPEKYNDKMILLLVVVSKK